MKKLVLSLSLVLAFSSATAAFAAIPQNIRIGTDPTYAPFESKNSQGELVGFDIDLAKELCKRINTQCTFVENPLDALIPSLKAKKIDAIMSSLSITEKRQQEIAFTDKLYAADSRLVVAKNSDIQPTVESLKGKRVGVLQGTTQETFGNEQLSQNRLSGLIFEGYTTLIRGVPDLVLMLLIFYGLQIALNTVTEAMGVGQIDIDPMVAGIITLGFIYGAYFTETFRGAFMAVPKGHIEAATAFGFTRGQVFRRIMFPSMMRYALPGIGNNWQVILKSTALVSLLGLEDVVKATQLAGKSTWEPFYFAIVCGVIYLVFTTVSNGVLLFLERRYSVGVKRADL